MTKPNRKSRIVVFTFALVLSMQALAAPAFAVAGHPPADVVFIIDESGSLNRGSVDVGCCDDHSVSSISIKTSTSAGIIAGAAAVQAAEA